MCNMARATAGRTSAGVVKRRKTVSAQAGHIGQQFKKRLFSLGVDGMNEHEKEYRLEVVTNGHLKGSLMKNPPRCSAGGGNEPQEDTVRRGVSPCPTLPLMRETSQAGFTLYLLHDVVCCAYATVYSSRIVRLSAHL